MGWLVRFSTSRIFALFLFAFRCLASDGAADHQDDSIVLKDGFVFVNAVINGHGPFRMLVDTGTTTTLLAPEAAAEAGLKFDHRIVLTSMGGKKPLPATSTGETHGPGNPRPGGIAVVPQSAGRDRSWRAGYVAKFLSDRHTIDLPRKKLWLGEDAIQRAEELRLSSRPADPGRTIMPVTRLGASRPHPGQRRRQLILKCGAHAHDYGHSQRRSSPGACGRAPSCQRDAKAAGYRGCTNFFRSRPAGGYRPA